MILKPKWTCTSPQSESESCSIVSDSLRPYGLYSSWNSSGQNTGVGSFSRLQEMLSTQGSNPGLPLYKRILYHKGRPRIQPWSPALQADSLPMSYEGSYVTSEIQIARSCHQFMILSTSALEFTFLTHWFCWCKGHALITTGLVYISLLITLFPFFKKWFLPYIHMNQPWVYMCSPSWPSLPPPSHPISGSSPCTSPEHPASCINLDWRSSSHIIIYMFQCYSLESSLF